MTTEELDNYKLTELRYKQYGDYGNLSGLQMVFANGLESPLFETRQAEEEEVLKTLKFENDRQIRLVSMKVDAGRYYHGIKFSDYQNKNIANVTWYDDDWGEWTLLKEIPADQTIIGMIVDSESEEYELLNISFLLGRIGKAEVTGEIHFPAL